MAKKKKTITLEFKDGSQREVEPTQGDNMVKLFPANWKIVEDYREAKPKEKREKD